MFGTQFQRLIHQSCCSLAASKKSLLVKLRKKTGVSLANCKKALENNDNDLSKAEQWLKDKAQAFGWSKAAELEGRQVTKGLVGLAYDKTHAALIEVNCETEFVTRNKQFQSLVGLVANSCLNYTKQQSSPKHNFHKVHLDANSLKKLVTTDGKSLADHTALVIGDVGENLQLKRATCMVVNPKLRLAGFVHPASDLRSSPLLGDYGSIVVFSTQKSSKNVNDVTRQICQHIIGMNPSKIGCLDEDSPSDDIENETVMIFQEFLFNPEVTIQQFLDINGIDVFGFERYQCGEQCKDNNDDLMDKKSAETLS